MEFIKNYKTSLIIVIVLALTFALLLLKHSNSGGFTQQDVSDEEEVSSVTAEVPTEETQKVLTVEEIFPHVIARNIPLYTYLRELNVASIDIIEMVKASKSTKNLSSLLPGTRFNIIQDSNDNLIGAEFRFSAVERLVTRKVDGVWTAEIIREAVDIKPISFVGHVNSTLWDSALEAKMDPYLIIAMSEIFGWEVDFNREVQVGDRWRITAEQKFVKGHHVGWGSVLSAEYVNQGVTHTAVLFRLDDEDMGYYNLEGENLRRMFLKSPLQFGRITSRFNRRRFHPKLKIVRPHNGVDYGAPIGTPVRSVANGTVTFAQYSGGGGKVLKIRHNSTYQTAYKHLNGFAKGVRNGARVKQGQIVAYVGNTGLSTGPHLHYEFYVNGGYVDPLRQKFPTAEPIALEHKDLFRQQARDLMATLPKWEPTEFDMEATKSWVQHLIPNINENFYLKADNHQWLFDHN